MRRHRTLLFLLVAVIVTACLEASPFVPKIESSTFDPSLGVNLAASTKLPSGVYIRDITVGGGTEVPADSADTVVVRYRGYLRNGFKFDSNVAPSAPFSYPTGEFATIEGFEMGVVGMKEGGERQIIIPPTRAYGGNPPIGSGIPAYSILVFNVTLVRVGLLPDAP